MQSTSNIKLIAFDLDGTLAKSKSPIDKDMAELITKLLGRYEVAVTSGGKFEQFKKQLIDKLNATPEVLARLHILPTNAAHYYRFDTDRKQWNTEYSKAIPADERAKIIGIIKDAASKLGYWESEHYGEIIEDRASQITFSALGQDIVDQLGEEGLRRKGAWDPDGTKKKALRDEIAKELPDYNVATGGMTSVDITGPGMDKASGLANLIKLLKVDKKDVVYIGDALGPGGNDAVVKDAGFQTIEVKDPEDTKRLIKQLLSET